MVKSASAPVKTVVHEEASRLPDTSWLWRRILIFAVCLVCLIIAWRVSERVADPATIRQINRYVYGLLGLCLLLYGVGATVTDVVRLITAFLSTKRITFGEPESAAPTRPAEDTGELPESERIR